ncbi:hypothetical protein ACJJIU_10030 [Microbulbifer sp. CnH-101-E]|uniref:hypothetical protein n=1 Tax=unclassified Microbulbifer TaxID=2619833 RepID=UPI00403A2B1D
MTKLVYVFLIMMVCGSSWAHQDTIIDLQGSQLVGLPEKYQPAVFDLEKNVLSIAGKRLVVPACYGQFFPKTNNYKISITASWYHSEVVELPPYMGIRIVENGESFGHFIQLEPLDLFCNTENKIFCEKIINYKSIEDSCYKKVEVVAESTAA